MCACNSHSLENRRLLWPTLDLKSSTVIVLLSHFHFHWGAASKQPQNSLARVRCTGGEPQQTNATTAEAVRSCAGYGPASAAGRFGGFGREANVVFRGRRRS